MARWYLQRGTAMVAPRGRTIAADLFVPFAVPVSDSSVIDLMDPDTYVLGLMPVQITNVSTDSENVDHGALLRGMLLSDIVEQFENAPRVGLVLHMNPDVGHGTSSAWTASSSASATAEYAESTDVFVVADTEESPRSAGNKAPEPSTFMPPCGFVKYFRNHIPCIQQGHDHGEASMRLLRSMLQFFPFTHLTTKTLQQYYRTDVGYERTEEQLQPIVRSLGEEMFHIHRRYGCNKATTQTKASKSAAVTVKAGQSSNPSDTGDSKADDDTMVPMETVVGAAQSRKRAAKAPKRAAKRTKSKGT